MITFTHKELTRVLELAASGVSKQENIEQGDSFVFSKGHVHTFNNEMAVSCALPSVPGVAVLEGAVNAKRLLALMKAWGDPSVSIGVKEGKELSIVGSKTRSGMRLQPDILLAIGTEGNPDPSTVASIDPKAFVTALKTVMPAASKEGHRPELCGIHVGSDERGAFTEATDGTQLCRTYFSAEPLFDHEGFFIPNDAARELTKFAPSSIGTNGTWVHFDCGDSKFACRTLGRPFPKCATLLQVPPDASRIAFAHVIDDSIGRVSLSAGVAGAVRFIIVRALPDKKVVRLEGTSSCDWAKEIVDAESSGEFSFAVDIDKFKEALTHSSELKVNLVPTGGGVLYASSENTAYIAALINVSSATAADEAEKANPAPKGKGQAATSTTDDDDPEA
jgi:DNA polymerase III sliding clamp (beta) subunit (PCNA family)